MLVPHAQYAAARSSHQQLSQSGLARNGTQKEIKRNILWHKSKVPLRKGCSMYQGSHI